MSSVSETSCTCRFLNWLLWVPAAGVPCGPKHGGWLAAPGPPAPSVLHVAARPSVCPSTPPAAQPTHTRSPPPAFCLLPVPPRCRSLPGAVGCISMTEGLLRSGRWDFAGVCGFSVSHKPVRVPAVLWGLGVLWLLLLPCEQFISFTDSSLLTSHSREDEASCLIRLKLVLSLDFPINKLLSRCHYLISVF